LGRGVTSRLAAARATLHGALSAVFDEPFQIEEDRLIAFSNGRVGRYPPPQVVAPCVWVEQSSGAVDTVGTAATGLVDVATFPVQVVYDGADRAQVAGLDELIARVWDAARTVGEPVRWTAGPVDAGGPNLRATVVEVEMRIGARTLCGSSPMTTEVVDV